MSRQLLQIVIAAVDVGVWRTQEQIDTIELLSVDLSLRGEIEHGIERDKGLSARAAFADETWPGGIMKFWEVILRHGGISWRG